MAQIEVDDHTRRELESLAAAWHTTVSAAVRMLIAAATSQPQRYLRRSCPGWRACLDASSTQPVAERVRGRDRVDGTGQRTPRRPR